MPTRHGDSPAKKADELRTAQPAANHDLPFGADRMYLKLTFRQIQPHDTPSVPVAKVPHQTRRFPGAGRPLITSRAGRRRLPRQAFVAIDLARPMKDITPTP